MNEQNRKPVLTRFELILLAAAILLLVFNYDPVGDVTARMFGEQSEGWVTTVAIIVIAGVMLLFRKLRRN